MTSSRIVARRPSTLSHRLVGEGVVAVSVTATAADGSVVLAAAVATNDPAVDPELWTVDVPPVATPTHLAVEWNAGNGWVETDLVEVAGGRYCTPQDLREHDEAGGGLNRDRFTDELLEEAILAVERRIERATNLAWVPRWERRLLVGDGTDTIALPPDVREILTLSIDDTVVAVEEFTLGTLGLVTRSTPGRFTAGKRVDVTLLRGHDAPPADLVDAAITAARELAKGDVNSRLPRTAESMAGGGITFNFAHQPDLERGRPFGLPDVDTVVMSHALDLVTVG